MDEDTIIAALAQQLGLYRRLMKLAVSCGLRGRTSKKSKMPLSYFPFVA